jgi:hypothetical protein
LQGCDMRPILSAGGQPRAVVILLEVTIRPIG